MKRWRHVREELGSIPIVEGEIGGDAPLYVERYLFRSVEKHVTGLDTVGLTIQLGGARVHEGETGHWRSTTLPSQGMLVPAHFPTHWHYSGAVDFAVFYFSDQDSEVLKPLQDLAHSRQEILTFSDQLVGAAALQLVSELQNRRKANPDFMMRLARVMLDQLHRVLSNTAIGGFDPRHIHYSRLQTVLSFIHENLAQSLSAETLAERADVSLGHLRRLFNEAMGVPIHRYILATRLEEARKMLALTSVPISRIAQECGFSSQSHLTACFRKLHAETPAQYRAQTKTAPGPIIQ
ncbi:MAG: helix-turn-helix domain-containing protein [Oceanococcus sp.]